MTRRFFCLEVKDGDVSRLSPLARAALCLTAPWTLIPWAIAALPVVNWISDRCGTLFPPTEITRRPESMLFLQGGYDWGGATEFVVLALLLFLFGLIAAIHLSLLLRTMPNPLPLGRRLRRAFRALLPFVVIYAMVLSLVFAQYIPELFGIIPTTCSGMFDTPVLLMTATAVYLASFLFIVWLDGRRLPGWAKTMLAPLFLCLWLALGSDGQTPRAGQMLADFEEPFDATRGRRHGAMLAWRRLCLLPFGIREGRQAHEDSSLWFWTTGMREFGEAPEKSRSARRLTRLDSLPWLDGPAFAVPIATDDSNPCRFTHCAYPRFRLICGYMLRTDARWRPLHFGRMDRPEYGARDIHLKRGQPYWTVSLTRDGATMRLNRFEAECWWHDPKKETDIGAPAVLTRQDEPVPTQLCFSDDVPYSTLTNWVVRLEDNGYSPLHIWRR